MQKEPRLIDATMLRSGWLENGQNEYVYDTNAVLDSIDLAPTVNAVPIPCHIGDTVYVAVFTTDGTGSHICERICSGIHISEKVTRWRHETPVRYLVLKTDDGYSIRIRMDEIGKSLFFTREDAEAALRKGRIQDAEMQDIPL